MNEIDRDIKIIGRNLAVIATNVVIFGALTIAKPFIHAAKPATSPDLPIALGVLILVAIDCVVWFTVWFLQDRKE